MAHFRPGPFLLTGAALALLHMTTLDAKPGELPDPLTGLWIASDQRDGKPRALIRIAERDGEFFASIEQGLRPEHEASPVCEKCPGARRNQPLLGMTIVWGMKRIGEGYGGGEILDPDTGQIYRCLMNLARDGKRLEVRGYLALPLLGRSLTWRRAGPDYSPGS